MAVRLAGETAWDLGDGALHYLNARYAPWAIYRFFDPWAKPLYVLLGCPFAQLGLAGMTVFNAVVAAATATLIISMIRPRPGLATWLVPVLLLGCIQYFNVVIAGLTEPLFGLVAVACIALLLRNRYGAAMVLLSFAPYARPEYAAFAPFAVAWVLVHRQWSALLGLVTGPAVYYGLGRWLLGPSIWTFSRDPYIGGKDYGTGPWDHFIQQAPDILGEPLLWAILITAPLLLVLFFKDRESSRQHAAIAVLALCPALAIWVLHSCVYWKGGFASSGLIRVLSTSTPFIVIVVAHVLSSIRVPWSGRWWIAVQALLFVAYSNWAVQDLRVRVPLPMPVDNEQRQVERAMEVIAPRLRDGAKLYAMHPYLAALTELNIFDTTRMGGPYTEVRAMRHVLHPGTLVQWDPNYGPMETGTGLRRLLEDSMFRLVSVHLGGISTGEPPFGIWLFERADVSRRWAVDTLVDTRSAKGLDLVGLGNGVQLDGDGVISIPSGIEFPMEIKDLERCAGGSPLTEWVVHYRLSDAPAEGATLNWVLSGKTNDPLVHYHDVALRQQEGEARFVWGSGLVDTERKAYLWDPGQAAVRITSLRIERRCLVQYEQSKP